MTAAYEQEQSELNLLIANSEQEIAGATDEASRIDRFLMLTRKYLNLQELDGTILRDAYVKL